MNPITPIKYKHQEGDCFNFVTASQEHISLIYTPYGINILTGCYGTISWQRIFDKKDPYFPNSDQKVEFGYWLTKVFTHGGLYSLSTIDKNEIREKVLSIIDNYIGDLGETKRSMWYSMEHLINTFNFQEGSTDGWKDMILRITESLATYIPYEEDSDTKYKIGSMAIALQDIYLNRYRKPKDMLKWYFELIVYLNDIVKGLSEGSDISAR